MNKFANKGKTKYIIDDLLFSGDYAKALVENPMKEAIRISFYIDDKCPAFSKFHSETVREVSGFIDEVLGGKLEDNFLDHPVHQLRTYSFSLYDNCWQTFYSIQRLIMLANWQNRAVGTGSINSYISYYFSGFLARVKTTTDVLALIINHIFELGIEYKRCGLDNGRIANLLVNRLPSEAGDNHQYIRQLARELEQFRKDWISDFYELRNIVTHRAEFWSSSTGIRLSDKNFPEHPFIIKSSPHTPKLLKLTSNIAARSIILDEYIDAIIFCEEIWEKLVLLIECVSNGVHPHISKLIAKYS